MISTDSLRIILLFLESILLIGIFYWVLRLASWDHLTFINLILLIPLTGWIIYKTYTAELKADYSYLSLQLKYLMMAGIASLSISNI